MERKCRLLYATNAMIPCRDEIVSSKVIFSSGKVCRACTKMYRLIALHPISYRSPYKPRVFRAPDLGVKVFGRNLHQQTSIKSIKMRKPKQATKQSEEHPFQTSKDTCLIHACKWSDFIVLITVVEWHTLSGLPVRKHAFNFLMRPE